SPELRIIGESFMRGINAYVADHPEEKPAFAIDLEPWHLITIGRAMIMRWPIGTIMGDLKNKDKRPKPDMGSNQWAVSPKRSATGGAILLTDPHLTWKGLAVFYEARVHAGDLHMNGFFLVGSPIMGYGHGLNVGWAPTTGGPDTGDVYQMKIRMWGPLPQYEYDGRWRMMEASVATIKVKEGTDVLMPILRTHLGPLISEPDFKKGVAYVGASPYLESTGLFDQILKMCMAKDVHEFAHAIAMNELMEQNLMYADTSGNIGYVRIGRAPVRPKGYDWNAPVPGHTSATAWLGIHPFDDLVQILNPEQGYMQNCNISPNNMMIGSPLTKDKYIDYLYNVTWDITNPRGKRIRKLLHENPQVTPEDALAYTTDIYDILSKPWQRALRQAIAAKGQAHQNYPDINAAAKRILAWDGRFTVDAIGVPLYKFWRINCSRNGKVDVVAISKSEELPVEQELLILEILQETIVEMKKKYGKWDMAWGDIHKVGRKGQFFPVPGADFNGGVDGPNFSETLFDVKSKTDKTNPKLEIAYSGSMAMMLMFFSKNGIESHTCVPWGQNADPQSPHFMDQGRELYSQRKLKPTLWTKQALLNSFIESKLVLETSIVSP
ncbi:MAG TPA: penicillin acylase family protein, partial [Verrucomicrobia bacterium]|nr:penicillin acylase family protein [Verrucomicrobiota bacterium]